MSDNLMLLQGYWLRVYHFRKNSSHLYQKILLTHTWSGMYNPEPSLNVPYPSYKKQLMYKHKSMATRWIWCVIWRKNFQTKGFRQIEINWMRVFKITFSSSAAIFTKRYYLQIHGMYLRPLAIFERHIFRVDRQLMCKP